MSEPKTAVPIADHILAAIPEAGASVAELHDLFPYFSPVTIWRALIRLRQSGKVWRRKGTKKGPGPKPDVWHRRRSVEAP